MTDRQKERIRRAQQEDAIRSMEVMFLQGMGYLFGEGVPRDPDKAVQYITAAANGGHPEAARELAFMYAFGNGVEPSQEEWVRWNKKANELEEG